MATFWAGVVVAPPLAAAGVGLGTLWAVSDAAERREARRRRSDCGRADACHAAAGGGAVAGAPAAEAPPANGTDAGAVADWARGPAVEIDASSLGTGDVLIYDRDPRRLKCAGAIAARGVKALQGEAWDHVGVIYRPDGGSGPPRVLEMSGKGLGDCPFEETINLCSANSLYLRRLRRPGGGDQAELDAWVEKTRQTPYENNMLEMYRAIHDSEEEEEHIRLVKELEAIREVTAGQPTPEEEAKVAEVERAETAAKDTFGANEEGDDSSLFCSELVAEMWQKMGALPEFPPANEYVPRDWMTPGDRNLPLKAGFSLAPPELVLGKKMPKNDYSCGCCRFCG